MSVGFRAEFHGEHKGALKPKKGRLKMRTAIAHFVKSESGATAIEYALIAAGISVAILVAVNSVGSSLTSLFNTVATDLTPAQ